MTPQPLKTSFYREVMDTVSDLAPEAERVMSYRQEEFRRFGYVDYVADFLAATHIDLHKIEDLIKQGCPLDVAAQILMGTDSFGEDAHWLWADADLKQVVALAEAEAEQAKDAPPQLVN